MSLNQGKRWLKKEDMEGDPLYITGGRLGDLIHVLAVIHANKVPAILYITNDRSFGGDIFSHGLEATYAEMRPLLICQPYIKEVRLHKVGDRLPQNVPITNLNAWREFLPQSRDWIYNLEHVYKLSLPNPAGGWLRAPPPENAKYNQFRDKIVIHHSLTRRSACFNWDNVLKANKCVFVSCDPKEYEAFPHRDLLPFHAATDLSDYANIIGSCKFFIGNLSSPLALAWALGGPFLAVLNDVDRISYMNAKIRWFYTDAEANWLDTFNHINKTIKEEEQRPSSVHLEVSVGEALDKMTILEIKQSQIKDPAKRVEVEKEMNTIGPVLKKYLEDPKVGLLYRQLMMVNQHIWDLIESSRESEEKVQSLAYVVMRKNDARFRVKNKINMRVNSNIKEQKSFGLTATTISVNNADDLQNKLDEIKDATLYYDEVIIVVPKALRGMAEEYFQVYIGITVKVLDE